MSYIVYSTEPKTEAEAVAQHAARNKIRGMDLSEASAIDIFNRSHFFFKTAVLEHWALPASYVELFFEQADALLVDCIKPEYDAKYKSSSNTGISAEYSKDSMVFSAICAAVRNPNLSVETLTRLYNKFPDNHVIRGNIMRNPNVSIELLKRGLFDVQYNGWARLMAQVQIKRLKVKLDKAWSTFCEDTNIIGYEFQGEQLDSLIEPYRQQLA